MEILYVVGVIYIIVEIPLLVTMLEGFPIYLAQAIFWPIWLFIEIILSTIRWFKSIKI